MTETERIKITARKRIWTMKKTGMTREEAVDYLSKTDGTCAICGHKQQSRCLAVDHDHRTGDFRGLLCTNCNHGLGNFFDDPELLREAAKYIENHNKNKIK